MIQFICLSGVQPRLLLGRDCIAIVGLIQEFVAQFRLQTFFVLNGKLNFGANQREYNARSCNNVHANGAR